MGGECDEGQMRDLSAIKDAEDREWWREIGGRKREVEGGGERW